MRVPASEKLEIIRLVEQSHLPARRTLQTLGILSSTFYRWYARFQTGGPEALEDNPSKPDRVWNCMPDEVRKRIIAMALDVPELSPRELAIRFTDAEGYLLSESSVYRLLKAHEKRIAFGSGATGIEFAKLPLDFDRASDSVHDTPKFHQRAVAYEFDDAARMTVNRRVDQLTPQGIQTG